MIEKDYVLYGTKVLNLKTQEIGLLICIWKNKFADAEINYATCVDKQGKAIKDYNNSIESPVEIQKKIEQIKNRIKRSYQDKLDNNLPYGMSERDWNEMMTIWTSELNQLEIKLKERKQKRKILYNKLSLKKGDLRTPTNAIIPTKKDDLKSSFVNGADYGIRTHVCRNHNPEP